MKRSSPPLACAHKHSAAPHAHEGSRFSRRGVLSAGLAILAGCGARASEVVVPEPPAPLDLRIAQLADLLTSVRLEWLVLAKPAELERVPWLSTILARIFQSERLDELVHTTGLDVRRASEIALASYASEPDDALAYLVRHDADPLLLERKFRSRLTRLEKRTVLGHQLTEVVGEVGNRQLGFVAAGTDVAGFQFGGDFTRGPAKIALLYAQGRLKTVPTALADPTLAALDLRLGPAPLKAFLPGPFDGELAQGARGLFAASTAVGLSLTPTASQTLTLEVFIGGDFANTPQAESFLLSAFHDLGKSDLGHLLGLHAPRNQPRVSSDAVALSLIVDLDPTALIDGATAATTDDVAAFMR